jgi:hypothetical protein
MIKAPHPSVGVCIMRTVLLAASRAALFSESAHAAPPNGGGTTTASPSRMIVFGNDNVSGCRPSPSPRSEDFGVGTTPVHHP